MMGTRLQMLPLTHSKLLTLANIVIASPHSLAALCPKSFRAELNAPNFFTNGTLESEPATGRCSH